MKKWLDAAATVSQQHIEVHNEDPERKLPEVCHCSQRPHPLQGFSADAVRNAAQREEAFSQAALAEEKMYLMWLNKQLKSLGKNPVNDISISLQDGTIIMEVLKVFSISFRLST